MKGFTLFELLVVLLILSLLLLVSLPVWQSSNGQINLWKEEYRLRLFLRKMQEQAENSPHIWFLIANRDLNEKRWCMTAQVKSATLCDCMHPQQCPRSVFAHFYYPLTNYQTMLISKKYYPNEMSRLSGIRDTQSTVCFILQSGQKRALFSLFNVGSVKLKNNQSMSACVND